MESHHAARARCVYGHAGAFEIIKPTDAARQDGVTGAHGLIPELDLRVTVEQLGDNRD